MQSYVKEKEYPQFPVTSRGYCTPFKTSFDKKYFAYPTHKTIVLRSFDDLSQIKVIKIFTKDITAIEFHPSEPVIAAVDTNNLLKLYNYEEEKITYTVEQCRAEKVTGILFTDLPNIVIVYGEGKKFLARAVNLSNPKQDLGEITKNSKTLLTGEASRDGSGIILLGGEEGILNVYKGSPYELIKNQTGLCPNKFLNYIKMSPDGSKLIAVGQDKSIFLIDPKTGEIVEQIAKDKSEGNHKMGIMCVDWINDDKFVTGSLDKTIKVWSLAEKKCQFTLNTAEKPAVEQMICGVVTNGKIVVALTLNGKINQWNLEGATDGKLPDLIYEGSQDFLNKVCYVKEKKEIYSSDTSGKIFKWNEETAIATLMKNFGDSIRNMKLSADEKYLFVEDRNFNIFCIELNEFKELFKIDIKGNVMDFILSESDFETVYILFQDSIQIYKKSTLLKKEKFPTRPTVLEVNEVAKEIYVGDNRGKIHVLDLETLKNKASLEFHQNEISAIKLSPDKKLLATGDTSRNVYIWNLEEKKMANNRSTVSTGKITEILWYSDSNHFMAFDLGGTAILYKNDEKKKVKEFKNIDNDGLRGATLINEEGSFICFGGSGVIFKIKGN